MTKSRIFFRVIAYVVCLLVGQMNSVIAQTWSPPDDMQGNGSSGTPYEITTAKQLAYLAEYVNTGNGNATSGVYYKLMSNIDLNEYTNWEPIGKSSVSYTTHFKGIFDGNSKEVRNLKINRAEGDCIGLFGYTNNAKIENLGVKNCNVVGKSRVGGLGGYSLRSAIFNCYVTGYISGNDDNVGGLVGYNENTHISNCYSTGHVSGIDNVGGLVGDNYDDSPISNSYSTSITSGNYCVGGLAGHNWKPIISNCYATGNVNGTTCIGGLVGYNNYNSTISNCYASGNINGTASVGGLSGGNSGTIRNCIAANINVKSDWNTIIDANRISTNTGNSSVYSNNYALNTMTLQYNGGNINIVDGSDADGIGKDLATLQSIVFYTTGDNWQNDIWDMVSSTSVWNICNGYELPFLRWQEVVCESTIPYYTITTIADANGVIIPNGTIIVNPGENKKFTFAANSGYEINKLLINNVNIADSIDGGSYTFANITANQTIEVIFKSPIFCGGEGTLASPYLICTVEQLKNFADYVNVGNGNATKDKYYKLINDIDLSKYDWVPIGDNNTSSNITCFQGNFDGNGKMIQNLTINNPTGNSVGLFGCTYNASITNIGIENCNIIASFEIGALVGKNNYYSTISNCYATGSISGNNYYAGGLVGSNYDHSSISNCYTTVNVIGKNSVGGFAGRNDNYSTVSNCYATGDVNGNNYYVGGMIGRNYNNSTISNCYATGNVSSGLDYVGGLVGYNYNAYILNCMAINNIVISRTDITDINRIAGCSLNSVCLNNYSFVNMVLKNSDGNVDITDGLATAGIGKNMDELQNLSFYTSINNWYNNDAWDIDSPPAVWDICDGEGFPFLRWQELDCGGGTTVITEIPTVEEDVQIIGYCNLMGISLPQEPEKGIYIILYDNGTTKKVMK